MCRFTMLGNKSWATAIITLLLMMLFVSKNYSQCDLSCKGRINISLNQDCEGLVTLAMVLSEDVPGATLEVFDEGGNIIPGNLLTDDYLNQEVSIIVTEPVCGNTCETIALVEDKVAPVITNCLDATISCDALIVIDPPEFESCDEAEIKLVNLDIVDISCTNEDYQQQRIYTYVAVDVNGNESEECVQTLTIEKFDLSTVEIPSNTDTTLYCDGDFPLDEEGNPHYEILGSPTLSGVDLYPDQFIACNTYLDYEDQVLNFNNCVTNIIRTWTVQNWFCGQDNFREFIQLFTIVDTVGPEITCPSDLTASTAGNECYAIVELPVLDVVDACNTVSRVDVNYPGGFLMDSNGGKVKLYAGNNSIEYIAYDECGNSSTCTYNIFVTDNAQPVTICDQFSVVALNTDGIGILEAIDVDDGSFDACGPVTLELRRVGDPLCVETDDEFGEYVTFCCEDIGAGHMVELRATDLSGNQNICMAFVEVQDKLAPVILAQLPDITVACTFPYDPDNLNVFGKVVTNPDDREEIVLTSEFVDFDGDPFDAVIMDNCTSVTSDDITSEYFNQCGIGYIIRTVIASNPEGQSVSFNQKISFQNNEAFSEDDIEWPEDYYPNSSCQVENLQPDDLPFDYAYPVLNEDECDMVGMTYEDQVITNTPDGGGCFKIIRTWYVSDWCQTEGNSFPIWTHDQYIEVSNDIAPEITSACADTMVCVYDAECGPGYIELSVSGSDDCVSDDDLIWSYEIDLHSDGSINDSGNTNNFAGEFEVGIHTVTWTLTDGCANFDVCSQQFEIRNCKAPTPYCINGLSADLTPMDLNDDGQIDTEMLSLTPDFFDVGSAHACGYDVVLSFSSDTDDTLRIFDCNDIGQQDVEIWVTDLVTGNQDYCQTYVIIQDNNDVDFCTQSLQRYVVSGQIVTENNEGISNVDVMLDGMDQSVTSDESGLYAFEDVYEGAHFDVIPVYETEDWNNGVSTLDLILIQKHILGTENLQNPYRIVAADINNSGKVTASDLIVLRKSILGTIEGFPENRSWKFIDSEYQFVDPFNPLNEAIPSSYNIEQLNSNMDIDFVGIKVGDVNHSIDMSGNKKATVRESGLDLYIDNIDLKADTKYSIALKVERDYRLYGYQYGLFINPNYAEILSVNGKDLDEGAENLGLANIDNGIILVNEFNSAPVRINSDDEIISITISAKSNVPLSDVIALESEHLSPESYNEQLDVKSIDLNFRDVKNGSESVLYQNSPNPFSNSTNISFRIAEAQDVQLNIFNLAGQRVFSNSAEFPKGRNNIEIHKNELGAPGVYYYEIQTTDYRLTKRMILAK